MAANAMKAKSDHYQQPGATGAPDDEADGWPPTIIDAIKTTSRRFACGEISDQAAFDELLAAGVSEQEAKALLRTFMLVSAH